MLGALGRRLELELWGSSQKWLGRPWSLGLIGAGACPCPLPLCLQLLERCQALLRHFSREYLGVFVERVLRLPWDGLM